MSILTEKLQGFEWAVYGSFNLYLQGIDIVFNDIDIATTKEDIFKIDSMLKQYRIEDLIEKEGAFSRCYRALYDISGQLVEVIADIEPAFDKFEGLVFTQFNGLKIPCYNLAVEYKGYKMMNRPKDAKKIEMIREKLDEMRVEL